MEGQEPGRQHWNQLQTHQTSVGCSVENDASASNTPYACATMPMPLDTFEPMPGLRNRHFMTILSSRWPRNFDKLVAHQKSVIVPVAPNASVLVEVDAPLPESGGTTLSLEPQTNGEATNRCLAIIVHGLEGSSRSHYVLGLSQKLLSRGITVARMNMRNCGGTLHLSNTLYNAGLSGDVVEVAKHFVSAGFERVFLSGFSLGGNVILKAAAELTSHWLAGTCAVSPSVDLDACVLAIQKGVNRIYEMNFLRSLKAKIREKNKLMPGAYDVSQLKNVHSIRVFDDLYTSIDGGYRSASDYYARASALYMMASIRVPTLILAAEDDPIVPFSSFGSGHINNSFVSVVGTRFGGHAGFVNKSAAIGTDRFWAETVAADFCQAVFNR